MDDLQFLKSLKTKSKRARTPTVLQMELAECGVASLSMILSYYKRYCTLEELRCSCSSSNSGIQAEDILITARAYGLESKAIKRDIQSLVQEKAPYIAFWNFNHFLVIEGITRKGVFVNDPALGRRKITLDEFCKSYTGIILTFTPGKDFKPGGSASGVVSSLKKRISNIKDSFIFLAIVQACMLVPKLSMICFVQVFIDQIFMDKHLEWKWYLLFSIFICILLGAYLNWAQGKCLYKLNAKVSIQLVADFFFHILKLPISFYQYRSSGELAYRLQLNDEVVNTITQHLSRAALDLLLVGFYAAIMFYFNLWIGLISVAEALCVVLFFASIYRKRNDVVAQLQQNLIKTIGYEVGGLQNIETIKSLALESDFFCKWTNINTTHSLASQEYGRINTALTVVPSFINALSSTAILGVGALLVIRGEISIGLLVALKMVSSLFVEPLLELVKTAGVIQETKVNLLLLDDSLNNKLDSRFLREVPTIKKEQDVHKLKGDLSIKDLTFSYSRASSLVIDHISFELKPGKMVAICGPTESGKTTLAALIAGLYEPSSGELLYDGKKRSEIPSALLKSAVATVDRNIHLFPGTIRDNLTLWDKEASDEFIEEAARDACIHHVIASREKGYRYEMSEQGSDFSGGERQRLEIARALVSRPSILVLDEALSSVDAEIEKEIIRNIKRRGCACLILSNRLSTINLCEEVFVLDRGVIVQRGTHSTLKEEAGFYKEAILFGDKVK